MTRALVYPERHGFGIRLAGETLHVPTISTVYDTLTPRGFVMGRTPFVWSAR